MPIRSRALACATPFFDRIREEALAIETARRIPASLAADLAAAGLFRMVVPTIYGGLQVHPSELVDTLIALSRADGAVGWNLMIGNTTGLLSASLPDHWAQTMYGNDPLTITVGVTAPMGRATPEGDGLRVSGRWPFGSGSHVANWICGGCLVMENGQPRRNSHDLPETLLVFFHKSDVTIHDNWHVSGLRGTGSNDIEVKDLLVPAGRWVVLGGKPRVAAPLYRFPTLGLLALGVSSVAVGIAEHAIDEFLRLAADKIPTGSTRALASRSSAQQQLAEAEAGVRAATALIHSTIDDVYAMAEQGVRLSLGEKARLRLAATHATWSSVAAVDKLYHAAGGSAIYQENPLQRCLRDIHVATQHIMVAQPTLEVVGKVMFGMDPRTLL